jgi:hypothetical protein
MNSALLLLLLVPQDLLEREVALRRRLAPSLEVPATKERRMGIELEAGTGFGCSEFDLKASFRSLFDRHVREEFLGGALEAVGSELAGSALVLACYASPTVCDAIKHYRGAAHAVLGMELEGCRSLEEALDDVPRRARARAIRECLDEKARQGMTLHEALIECRRAARLRGLDGAPTGEIDLVRDLGLPEALAAPLVIGPGTLKAEVRAGAVLEAYESRRRDCVKAWEAALGDPERAELAKLGPVTRAEVERLSLMEPASRGAAVRSLAAASALHGLVREAHDVERALESAGLVATTEVREEMERRRLFLRGEVARLLEAFEAERRLSAALEEVRAAAEADVSRRARERLAPRRAAAAGRSLLERSVPWGCELLKE